MIDDHRAVLFGGMQPLGRLTKERYILDLTEMVCTYLFDKYFPHTVTLHQLIVGSCMACDNEFVLVTD